MLKNESKAYALFKTAADMKIDGDSSFNTGFCLHHGIGVEKDLQLAHYYYNIAAHNFGHFDSIRALGTMYYNGLGVVRSPEYALTYFAATLNIGPWNGWLRKGLDRYLDGDYVTALACYAFAAELGMYIICTLYTYSVFISTLLLTHAIGFEIAQSNAAYVIRTKLNSAHTAHSTLILPWSSPWRMLTTRSSTTNAGYTGRNNTSTGTAESIRDVGLLVSLLKDGIGASDRVLYILHYRLQKSEYATI